MTSKERVVKTLNREPVDCLPVDYLFADNKTLHKFSESFGMSVDNFLDYLGVDIRNLYAMDDIQLFISNSELMEFAFKNGFARRDEKDKEVAYDRWGVGWHMNSDGQRPVSRVMENVEEIPDYQAPDPIKDGQFYDAERNIRKHNDKGYAVGIVQYYGIYERGWLIRGFEDFIIDCYENREYVEILLDKIMNYKIQIAEEIVKYGVAFGHFGDDYGIQSGPLIPLDMWRELFKPRLAKIWDVYKRNNLPVVHHSCGDCMIYLDDMIEIGLNAIHPVQATAMDINELSRRYGSRLVFYGGIDCRDILTTGTPEDIRKNVEQTVSVLGKNKGLILAPINIMRNVPLDNFKALVESVNKYKFYI